MKNRLVFLCHLFFCFLFVNHIQAQHTCVFVGSFNWSKDTEGIYVYELDTANGTLERITSYIGISNPSYLTLSPTGKYVYACTESKTPGGGSVSSYEFNYDQKSLRLINSQPSVGENPVYVSLHKNGKWLVDGNYTQGSISVYPVLANGSIDSIAQHIQFQEGSVNAERQDRSHIHATVFSPDNSYVFVTDLGADKIRCYRFDSLLSQPFVPGTPDFVSTYAGSGPRHFTFHPNGNYAYCIEELSGSIETYRYKNGKLSYLQRAMTHPNYLKKGFESSDIHLSPDGRFLYASNRGIENNIVIFSVLENGLLEQKGYQSTMGLHPRVFAIDESGKFLIVANVNTGNLVVFKRDLKTGLLRKTSETTELKNPSCVKFFKYNTVD